jgi:hypothetical protein
VVKWSKTGRWRMSTSSELLFLTPRLRLGVAARTIENDFPPLSSVRTRFGQVPSPPPPLHHHHKRTHTHTHTQGKFPRSARPPASCSAPLFAPCNRLLLALFPPHLASASASRSPPFSASAPQISSASMLPSPSLMEGACSLHATVLLHARTLGRLVHFVKNSCHDWFVCRVVSSLSHLPLSRPLSRCRSRSLSRAHSLALYPFANACVCVRVRAWIHLCMLACCACLCAPELCVSMCARRSRPGAPGLGCVCDEVGIRFADGHPSGTAC